MKLKYILFIMVVITAFGCNDDFMERYPLDRLSDENFWRSESDLELYCNTLYDDYVRGHGTGWANSTRQPYGYQDSYFCYGDLHSDNGVPKNYSSVKMVNGKFIEPTGAGGGGWNWGNVRKINYFLANYKRGDIEPTQRNIYAGEIMLFKAWEYFEKVKIFGDVPWYSEPLETDSEGLYTSRTPRAEVMDSILMCINKAIEWLPEKGSEKNNRLNKDIALQLKARICLHEGTFRKYHTDLGLNGDKFLQEAVSASDALMNAGYSIWSTGDTQNDYHELFIQDSYANNPEILLWKEYATDILGHATLRYYNFNLRMFASCSKSMVEEYLCTDGLPISSSPLYLGDDSIQSEMSNRDPRLKQTIAAPGEYIFNPNNSFDLTQMGEGYNNAMPNIPGTYSRPTATGYRPIKYWKDDATEINAVTKGIMPCPIFRYAEILLINAEAKAELGQISQSVLDETINLLRDRVGMPHLNVADIPADPAMDDNYSTLCGYTPSPILREIRRERRVELGWENFRWDDLVRWKAGKLLLAPKATMGFKFNQYQYPDIVPEKDVYLNSQGYIMPYKLTLPEGRVFEEPKQYYFPIPIEDLVMNKNLEQNPGWKDAGSIGGE